MEYHNDNELYHYGVKGMKWGVRRTKTFTESTPTKKKRLGIDKHGNINLVEQTSKSGQRKFAIKVAVLLSAMGIASYMAKHPETVMKGYQAVTKILKTTPSKAVEDISTDSNIFSKKLGRVLTITEAAELGLY